MSDQLTGETVTVALPGGTGPAWSGLVPGHCAAPAHERENLGLGGRVRVSRAWTSKTLAEHKADRRAVVAEVLAAAGYTPSEADRLAASHSLPDGRPRFVWHTVPVVERDYVYFAGLRPAEAANLRIRDVTLPAAGWGDIVLSGSYQPMRAEWTDDRRRGEERGLKHRARAATRRVPAAPELVEALSVHVDTFGTGAEGRLFVTRTGRTGRPVAQPFARPVSSATTTRVLGLARGDVLTPAQQASPLARRPYDLRHACVSTWLAAGVAPSQVAAWAGHSVPVLLRVYAHAVDGQEDVPAAGSPRRWPLHHSSTTAQPRKAVASRYQPDQGQTHKNGPLPVFVLVTGRLRWWWQV